MNSVPGVPEKSGTPKRRLRKGRLLGIILAAAAIIVAAQGLFLASHKEYIFAIGEAIGRIGKEAEKPSEGEVETVQIKIGEFLEDVRVEKNDSLMLINTEHLIPEYFSPEIGEYKESGVFMNTCIMPAYEAIAKEVYDLFGEKLYISSAWRTPSEQEEAIAEEGDAAQQVGASEHQAGLALDVYTMYHAGMAFLDDEPGKWVNRNCQNYGLIIRYPYDGERETGISYEPWHLRYVGQPHAQIIASNGMTLEGYIASLEPGRFYTYGEYTVTRQSGQTVSVPKEFESAVVSDDNCGGWVMTFR